MRKAGEPVVLSKGKDSVNVERGGEAEKLWKAKGFEEGDAEAEPESSKAPEEGDAEAEPESSKAPESPPPPSGNDFRAGKSGKR